MKRIPKGPPRLREVKIEKPLPEEKPVEEFEEKVVEVDRVTYVVAGGKRMRFRALVVIGDRKGQVGVGLGKANEVPDAVAKAVYQAKKSIINVPIKDGTIPHEIKEKYKSALVLLKPASKGTGIIAGGPVRAVIEMSGITDILSKMLGSENKINNVMATYEALKKLKF